MNLKIAAPRHDIVAADVHENLITAAATLNHVDRDTDVVVLPELFSTGFVANPEVARAVAEGNDGHTIDDVTRWASYFGFAIAGTFMATDGSRLYNRAFFVEPSGDRYFYDKHHLFSLGTEAELLTAGTTPSPVIRYRGWNFKMFVCYDLRFPVWCRKRDNEFDVMLFPANWPEARLYQFHQLLSARAIENNAIVVGANRVGSDAGGVYPVNGSAIFDLLGHSVGSTDHHGTLYATFDYDRLNRQRDAIPTYREADRFTLC